MASFEIVLSIIPWLIIVLCVVLLGFSFLDRKKGRRNPPAVPDETAPQQPQPRSKTGLIGGILFLVVGALNFGQGNILYGVAMLLLGIVVLLFANGVLRR